MTFRTSVAIASVAILCLFCLSSSVPQRPVSIEDPEQDSPEEAVRHRNMLMADEFGNIPADGLTRALAEVDAMRAFQRTLQPLAAGITRNGWTWLGPGNIGGRVRAIAVHPTSTSTIFAGSVAGGIWKSTNSGGTWSSVDDWMATLAVSCIVFQPGDASIMYAGTGEGFYNFDRIRGAGIFKSLDGGATWAQLASTATSSFQYVNRIAISPDGLQILVATPSGIYRSTNGGSSFTKTYTVTNSTRVDITDIKFLPGSNAFAVASGYATNAYYSTDGGQSWTPATGITPAGTFNRVEIAVAPATPATVFLSVDHQYPNTPTGQIWRSDNSGQSYVLVSTPGILGSQAWYDNAIWVDPTDSTRLVVGGQQIYRSTNSGVSFTTLTGIHSDFHTFVSDPGYNGTTNRRIYIGGDGGVFKKDDITSGTSGFVSLNSNIGITQFYGAGGNTTSGKIIGGTQDNGTLLYVPANGSNGWSSAFGGDGGYSAADPFDPNYLYGEVQYGWLHRNTAGGSGTGLYIFGLMNGNVCKPAPRCVTDAFNRTINFIPPFILDPNNNNRLLLGGNSLWRTDDVKTPTDYVNTTTGPSWSAIKAATGSYINTIAIAKNNSDIVWVGHNNGNVYMTTNGTSPSPTWTQVDNNATALPNRAATRIVIDSGNANNVFVSFGGFNGNNVWRTTNGGGSWTQATGSAGFALPAAPVYSLAIHPNNPAWIYAGTEVGIFASTDSGATWSLPHDGPANVSTDELFWMGTRLIAVTHGRGLFSAETVSAPGAFAHTSPSNGAAGQPAATSLSWGASAGATSYEYCLDITHNNACDASWISVGTATSVNLMLAGGTPYSWHVRALNAQGETYADGAATTFWSFATKPRPRPQVDLNGDGNQDVFTYSESTGVWKRQLSQAGSFVEQGQGNWAPGWTVTPAVFNDDLLTDFFLFNTTTGAWSKMLNDGTGFTPQASGQWWPGWERYVMELDGDGVSDLFLSDPSTGTWFKCVSTVSGFTYSQGGWNPGWEAYPMTLNSDALGDLFLISRTTGRWFWVLGANGSTFTYPATETWFPAWQLYPGDFNGDGLSDLLLHDPPTGNYFVATNTGNGFTYVQGGWSPGWTPYVADFNADGTDDLFLHDSGTGVWFEMIGDGAGHFTNAGGQTWSLGWQLHLSDLNGDRRADVVLYHPASGVWYQARNFTLGSFTYTNGSWAPSLTVIAKVPIR